MAAPREKVQMTTEKPIGGSDVVSEQSAAADDVEHGSIRSLGNGGGIKNAGYSRRLTKRQVMMMVFGAGIGTGLWVGTGQALHYGKSISIHYSTPSYPDKPYSLESTTDDASEQLGQADLPLHIHWWRMYT